MVRFFMPLSHYRPFLSLFRTDIAFTQRPGTPDAATFHFWHGACFTSQVFAAAFAQF